MASRYGTSIYGTRGGPLALRIGSHHPKGRHNLCPCAALERARFSHLAPIQESLPARMTDEQFRSRVHTKIPVELC